MAIIAAPPEQDRERREADDAQEPRQRGMHEADPRRRVEHLVHRGPKAHQHEEHSRRAGDHGEQVDGSQRGVRARAISDRRGRVRALSVRRGGCELPGPCKPAVSSFETPASVGGGARNDEAVLGVRHRKQGRGSVLSVLRHAFPPPTPAFEEDAELGAGITCDECNFQNKPGCAIARTAA
jgi:hypothetical protein